MLPRTIPLMLVGATFAGAITMLLLNVQPSASEARPIVVSTLSTSAVSIEVSAELLRRTLHRLELDPRSLTAAGVTSSEELTAVASGVKNYLSENGAALATADAAVVSRRQTVAALEHHVQAGIGTAQDASDLASARTELASAESTRASLLNGLFNAGVASLTEAKRGTLSTIRENAENWVLPVEFLTVTRTEAEWVVLRHALAHERIAAKRSDTVDGAVEDMLSDARSDTAVASAISNLASSLSTVEQSWQTSTAQ